LIPWSPLVRGTCDDISKILYKNPADIDIIDRNAQLAERLGVKPAQTVLAWVLGQPGITAPIVGAAKLSQLQDARGTMDLALTKDDRFYLEKQ
jgi:aryl-alcohol dehydrogenase (NADP+)